MIPATTPIPSRPQRILAAYLAGEKVASIALREGVTISRVSTLATEAGLRRRKARADRGKPRT